MGENRSKELKDMQNLFIKTSNLIHRFYSNGLDYYSNVFVIIFSAFCGVEIVFRAYHNKCLPLEYANLENPIHALGVVSPTKTQRIRIKPNLNIRGIPPTPLKSQQRVPNVHYSHRQGYDNMFTRICYWLMIPRLYYCYLIGCIFMLTPHHQHYYGVFIFFRRKIQQQQRCPIPREWGIGEVTVDTRILPLTR